MMKKILLIITAILLLETAFTSCHVVSVVPVNNDILSVTVAEDGKNDILSAEIIVGCPVSLTGMFDVFGKGGVFGAEAAVQDINDSGGIYIKEYDRKLLVRLVVVDNESDPSISGPQVEGLILREKVDFIISPIDCAPLLGGRAIAAEKYQVPHVAAIGPMEVWLGMQDAVVPTWGHTWLTGFSINTPAPQGDFRNREGYTIVSTWMDMLSEFKDETNGKAAIFASDEPDGRTWYDTFGSVLEQEGYDVIGFNNNLGLFPLGTADFTFMINEWIDSDAEILWGNCPAPIFGMLWKQCMELGFQPKMVGAGRAALFYQDIISWGGDLPYGICTEV